MSKFKEKNEKNEFSEWSILKSFVSDMNIKGINIALKPGEYKIYVKILGLSPNKPSNLFFHFDQKPKKIKRIGYQNEPGYLYELLVSHCKKSKRFDHSSSEYTIKTGRLMDALISYEIIENLSPYDLTITI